MYEAAVNIAVADIPQERATRELHKVKETKAAHSRLP